MSLYLITGVSGSGKTTLTAELKARGYTAYDGDEYPKLASWKDAAGQTRTYDAEAIRTEAVHWLWDETVLNQLITESSEPTFLCGSSANTVELIPRFAAAWLLKIDEATLHTRLDSPTRKQNFGKDPEMRTFILSYLVQWQRRLAAAGARPIDGRQPTSSVADTILVQLNLPAIATN